MFTPSIIQSIALNNVAMVFAIPCIPGVRTQPDFSSMFDILVHIHTDFLNFGECGGEKKKNKDVLLNYDAMLLIKLGQVNHERFHL